MGGEKSRIGPERKGQWRNVKGRKVREDAGGEIGTVVIVY